MLVLWLVASLLLVTPAAPARAQAAPAPSGAATAAPEALVLARSAAEASTTALERTSANLEALLMEAGFKPSRRTTLQVFSKGRHLTVRPLGPKGGLAVDAPTRTELRQTGRAIRFVARPQPHFLVAAETRLGSRRSIGVEVPLRDMAQALDGVRLPANTSLELLSREGAPLAHPQRQLPPEERAVAASLAGGIERQARADKTILGYAPIAETGVGVLVRSLPMAAPEAKKPSPLPAAVPEPSTAHLSGREGLFMTAGGTLVGLLFVLVGWLRQRWQAQLQAASRKAETPALSNVARLSAGVASGLPALRESLGMASRALDRAFVAASSPPPQMTEAHDLAQDISEQAAGLLERLQQANGHQPLPLREVSGQLTQLALDLALAATQPDRQSEVGRAAAQLKEIAALLPHLEGPGDAPSLPYLTELAAALKARCERMEGVLSAESEDGPNPQLQAAREALEKAIAQNNTLADRVRTLERHLPIPEDGV